MLIPLRRSPASDLYHPSNLKQSSKLNPSQESQNMLVNLGLICSNEFLLLLHF